MKEITMQASLSQSAIAWKAYILGMKDGIEAFAYWKDGIEYVGTCGRTKKEAFVMVDKGELPL